MAGALAWAEADALAADYGEAMPARGACVWWLGQAGFLVAMGGLRLAIDPYLSDSLARKYAGTPFPHRRMADPPLEPGAVRELDWLLCTHAHTDHMDPETIRPLLAVNPRCRVVAPEAERATVLARGVPATALVGVDAGHALDLGGVRLDALPAAHEAFRRDAAGRHHFLGYVLTGGGCVLYHSGDTVPFAGLSELLTPLAVDLALLPVNGRDEIRRSHGVPGNMTLEEAVALAGRAGARAMLGHHFGMFDFNTIDPVEARRRLAELAPPFVADLAMLGRRYTVMPRGAAS